MKIIGKVLGVFSLRMKLAAGFGAIVLAIAVTTFLQWSAITEFDADVRTLLTADSPAESLLLNIDRDSYQAQIAIEQMATAPGGVVSEELLDDYSSNRDQTLSRWITYQETSRGLGDEESRWPAYDTARDAWVAFSDQLVNQLVNGDEFADGQLAEQLIVSRDLHNGLRDVLDGIVEEVYVPQAASFETQLDDSEAASKQLLIAGVIMSLVIAIIVGGVLEYNLSKPIQRISRRAKLIASGDMSGGMMRMSRRDEVGALANTFDEMTTMLSTVAAQTQAIANGDLSDPVLDKTTEGEFGESFAAMVRSLETMVGELRLSASELSEASGSLTSVSSSLNMSAQETYEQAAVASATGEQITASVSSVASAIDQMNSSIREVSSSASEASNAASSAVEVAETTSKSISKLGESSEEIGSVIKVISSIADQTNLLALNATIEAARAGEAGKGFAVVANEVKELATQTADATAEISTRINAIQTDISGAVSANEEIGETIHRINEISTRIASAVEEQSMTTAEIGRNFEQAASGTEQIALGITGVAASAEQTKGTTKETYSSAEQLSTVARKLDGLVSSYS